MQIFKKHKVLADTMVEDIIQKKDLSIFEKILCIASGPITGMLPPRVQQNIGAFTKNDYQAASLMSTTSRVVNALWSGYTAMSLVGKAFGVDIDPTPLDAATYVGIPIAIDTVVREVLCAFAYGLNGGNSFMDYFGPWGEPFLSGRDVSRNHKWYN